MINKIIDCLISLACSGGFLLQIVWASGVIMRQWVLMQKQQDPTKVVKLPERKKSKIEIDLQREKAIEKLMELG